MALKKWVVREADKEKASALSEKFNIDPFIAFILVSRGIDDDLTVSNFLAEDFETVSPFSFEDMDTAAFTVGDAVDNGERICIFGDYDCDGVTSTALLLSFLREEGADVFAYIPDRMTEGYGMNKDAIDAVKAQGASLIVTVDNGISAVEEAEYIYSLGMRLVITDHHQIGDTLPRAEAVVNPYRPENRLQFRDFCGVGVAFQLACAIYEGAPEDLVTKYIDLVAIGTIADVVPLLGENRAFVKAGLQKINFAPRPSVKAFLQANGGTPLSANEVAFRLSPRINAMGRMGDAMRAVDFLLCEDEKEARFMCEQLNEENAHRQEMEKSILADVRRQAEQTPSLVQGRVVVLAGRGYHHGVLGIVASHIAEQYAKPTFIVGIDDNGVARGSARSVGSFNIFEAISACSEDLIQFGGHPLAAGVTLTEDKIDAFREHINAFALEHYDVMPPQELVIDCRISPRYLNLDLVDSLSVLEPCGAENPRAVFGLFNMNLVGIVPMGDGKHLRLELEKKAGGALQRLRVAKFNTTKEDFPFRVGDMLHLAVRVSKNYYNDKTYLSVQAVDVRLAAAEDAKYFKEYNAYERCVLTGEGDASLYPTREVCAAVYRFLKANGDLNLTREDVCLRLQQTASAAQVLFALDAFLQAGLIENAKTVTLQDVSTKVNLEQTPVLQTLKGRWNIE